MLVERHVRVHVSLEPKARNLRWLRSLGRPRDEMRISASRYLAAFPIESRDPMRRDRQVDDALPSDNQRAARRAESLGIAGRHRGRARIEDAELQGGGQNWPAQAHRSGG